MTVNQSKLPFSRFLHKVSNHLNPQFRFQKPSTMSNVDDSINPSRNQEAISQNVEKAEIVFSPRFRSIAAMAGWDEEALLLATSIVEDTPDRLLRIKKRSILQNSKSPLSNSRRKRKTPRRNPASIPITALNLDEDLEASSSSKQESSAVEEVNKKSSALSSSQGIKIVKVETKASTSAVVEKSTAVEEVNKKSYALSSSQGIEKVKVETKASTSVEVEKSSADEKVIKKGSDVRTGPSIPCIDRLREELSCAICLDICYEPSTTPCGHSFCKQCLRSAADKCGKKCPKCRQLISNGKYCTINTVLWNTIQLLFPQEIEARKITAVTSSSVKPEKESSSRDRRLSTRNRAVQALNSPESESETTYIERRNNRIGRRNLRPPETLSRREVSIELPSQDEDAALALRLQREEFMAVRLREERRNSRVHDERRNTVAVSRANLRAIAARADIVSDEPRNSVSLSRANLRAMAAGANNVSDEPTVPNEQPRHSLATARANLRAMARAINVRSRDRTR